MRLTGLGLDQWSDIAHTRPRKNLTVMRRLGQLRGQLLPWKMQPLMQRTLPLWAISDIVHLAVDRNKFGPTALTIAPPQLTETDWSSLSQNASLAIMFPTQTLKPA